MDDPGLVRDMDGPGQSHHQFGRLLARLGSPRQPVVEAAAIEQLERDERQAGRLADVVDLDDVGVSQPRDRLGLHAEAGQVVGPRLAAAADHLQGDQAVQPEMPRLVDDPHAPFAQPLEDVVAGDGRPVRGSRRATELCTSPDRLRKPCLCGRRRKLRMPLRH